MRIGLSGAILETMNPFNSFSFDTADMFAHIYPSLVEFNENLEPIPNFAESWKTSDGGRTWTFTTAEGGKWSDGMPVTAKDAVFTINLIKKFEGGALAGSQQVSAIANLEKAEAPNNNTLVVHYSKPAGTVLWRLGRLPILPEQVWSKQEGSDGKGLTAFSNYPTVSGGPFLVKEYKKGSVALFETNPSYYGEEPKIDGFGILGFKNADEMITALKTGQIDLASNIPATAMKTLEGDESVEVVSSPGGIMDTLYLNQTDTPEREHNRALLDPKVKEAFDHAINREELINVVWLGQAVPGGSFVPTASGKWHDSSIEAPEYNPDLANEILDKAGYKRGPDGIRIANGEPMEFEDITTTDNDAAERISQVLDNDFNAIGVKLTQKSLDPSAAVEAMEAPDGKELNWAMNLWYAYGATDFYFYSSLQLCDAPGTGTYCNQKFDALYEKAQETVSESQQVQIVHEMQQVFAEDRPEFELDYRNAIDAHSSNWTGFVSTPQGVFGQLNTMTLRQVHEN